MQRWMKYTRSRCRRAKSCALGCALGLSVFGAGCTTVYVSELPPCPTPTLEAIEQTVALDGTALGYYLGEIERYCDAVEAGR